MDSEQILVALFFLFFGVVGIFLQIAVIMVFTQCRSYNRNPCFRIMASLAVADIAQLSQHVFTACKMFSGSDPDEHSVAEKFFGLLGDGCWHATVAHTLILAINRLQAVANVDQQQIRTMRYANCMIAGCWLICAESMASNMAAGVDIIYREDLYTWNMEGDSALVQRVESLVDGSLASVAFVVYVAVVAVLYIKRHRIRGVSALERHRRERWLLLQSMTLYMMCIFIIVMWHYAFDILPVHRFTSFGVNATCVIYCFISPVLYLTMSPRIRRDALRYLFSVGKPDSKVFFITALRTSAVSDVRTGSTTVPTATSRLSFRRAVAIAIRIR